MKSEETKDRVITAKKQALDEELDRYLENAAKAGGEGGEGE
jgi:hypothetical protein